MSEIKALLLSQGYRLAADSSEPGRLTFMHDDNADRPFLLALSHTLRYAGWQSDASVPPRYHLPGSTQLIEIEPGGADTSGHYLHLFEFGF
jgi:hypothetical protein